MAREHETEEPWAHDDAEEDQGHAGGNGKDKDPHAGMPEPTKIEEVTVMQREWSIPGLVPHKNLMLISGEGAVGKSILLLQKDVAHVLGRDWLGHMPRPGPIVRLSCEDEIDEEIRRLEDIAVHLGSSRKAIAAAGFMTYSFIARAGDMVLFEGDRRLDTIKPTSTFAWLKREVAKYRPVNVTLDTVSDIFAGNEISRAQVRSALSHLRNLAQEFNTAVTLSSHPSNFGIKAGTGLSGSTHWHNGVRARAYLTFKEEGSDVRQFEWHKNQYSQAGTTLLLQYQKGVFVPVTTADREHRKRDLETAFLAILDRYQASSNMVLSPHPGGNYAPRRMEPMSEMLKIKATRKEIKATMHELIERAKIEVATEGDRSHARTMLRRVRVSDLGEALRGEDGDDYRF